MHKRSYLYFVAGIVLLTGAASCHKYGDIKDYLSGQQYLGGRVFNADSLTGPYVETVKPGVIVRLSKQDSGENYIISATADANGYFSFDHLDGGNYYLIAEDSVTGLKYKQRLAVTTSNSAIELVLNPVVDGSTGISFSVLDPAGSTLSGAELCIFNNAALATDTNCNGSIKTQTTNINGKTSMIGLSPGQYVVNAKYRQGNVFYFKRFTVTLVQDSIKYATLRFDTTPLAKSNSITYFTTDAFGGILQGVQICGFASQVLANDSCYNRSWEMTSDTAAGKAYLKNIPPSYYVVFLKKQAGSVTLRARDTINYLSDSTIYSKTIMLH